MTGDDIIAVARSWIGTPYIHQGSVRAGGCDCLGLLRGVWRELVGEEPIAVPPYARFGSASAPDQLSISLGQFCEEISVSDMTTGTVLLFRLRANVVPRHIGILNVSDAHPTFIHAYSRHGVVENALSVPWRHRIARAFELPGKE